MSQKKRKKLWSAEKMFETVLIAAPMSEAEKSEYCRKQGIYPVQLNEWKEDCIAGCRNAPDKKSKNTLIKRGLLFDLSGRPQQNP